MKDFGLWNFFSEHFFDICAGMSHKYRLYCAHPTNKYDKECDDLLVMALAKEFSNNYNVTIISNDQYGYIHLHAHLPIRYSVYKSENDTWRVGDRYFPGHADASFTFPHEKCSFDFYDESSSYTAIKLITVY